MNQIEELKALHYKLRELLDKKDYQAVCDKLTELSNGNDINKQKTALLLVGNITLPELKKSIDNLKMAFNRIF